MNKENNNKESSIKESNINLNQENINSSNNLLNLTDNINSNLSEINEDDLSSYNLEDKKAKHSSSFQQATEIIHSIQSFFQSFKKNSNESFNSLDSSNKINNLKQKKSLSDIDLVIKKEKQIQIDEVDLIETSTNMDKIKIQRSKSIPFNNTNSSQRNSCHYHKHSSLSSSLASSITAMSINYDQGRHYDSESETNDSRLEYSTPKEDDVSFSFTSCQSSFSLASAFTNKMVPIVNNYSSDIKGDLPLSPKSMDSEKLELLSETPHVTGIMEDIKEQEYLSEALSTTPLGPSSIVIKDDLGTQNDVDKETSELDKKLKLDESKIVVENSDDLDIYNKNNYNMSLSSLSNGKKEKELTDRLKLSTSSIPQLLNQNQLSPLSSSSSTVSPLEIQPIQPSSPSYIKVNFNNSPINKKEDKNEDIGNKTKSSLSSLLTPIHTLSSSPSNAMDKSPELFKMDLFETSSNLGTSEISNKKSLLLFSSSLSSNNDNSNSSTIVENNKINEQEKETISLEFSTNKILIINNNNRIDSDDNEFSSSYKDNVHNSITGNCEEQTPKIENKNEIINKEIIEKDINEPMSINENKIANKENIENGRNEQVLINKNENEIENNIPNKENIENDKNEQLSINENEKEMSNKENIENGRNDEQGKENLEKEKENLDRSPKQDKKIVKNRSKDSYLNHLYNNLINEDTLVDSENSSYLSNIVSISESELTSIPITSSSPNEVQHSFESKSSNLVMEDLDNAEEEFIQINNNEIEDEKNIDKIEDNNTISSKEKVEPVITVEDADLPKDHEKTKLDETNNAKEIVPSEKNSLENHNMSGSNYLLKERSPNEDYDNKHELFFSKELTSSIANNSNEKKDEDNYSYYSNAFSPEISISSVNSEDKYTKNYYEKPQFYKKNRNNKKSGDYEKSIKEYAVSLEKEMMDFYLKNVPTEESKMKKLSLLKRIQKMFSERYPTLGIKAHLFGSSVNELGTYNSDVDICLTTRDRIDCELRDMEVIKRILEDNGITQVRTTPNAKVPICNFVDPETNLSCDINVNNTIALYNTKMIQTYALIDERVKPLIMTIKYFAKQRMLNDAKTGTLSSYCWVNLVINFLQMRRPPILPCLHAMSRDIPEEERIIIDGIDCTFYSDLDKLKGFGKDNKETLYELIYGFFKTFASDFDYITDVVSVRSGCYKKKSDNGWNVSSNNTQPFNTSRNLANCANRYSVKGLRWEFKRAFKILKARGSLEELCEPYKPDPSNYSYDATYYYPNQNRMELPVHGNLSTFNSDNIHNDHLYLNHPKNSFSNYKNGKNINNSFTGGQTMADKNGNWRIRSNNSGNTSSLSNNSMENINFQHKFTKNMSDDNKLMWNMKKKPFGLDVSNNEKTTSYSENFYFSRRFPNDASFMNNHYSSSTFIPNKKVNRYTGGKGGSFNNEKDIHNSKNEKTSSNYEKSSNGSMKEMNEMDNEKGVIKHRFIEHHRNFDNSISSSSSYKIQLMPIPSIMII
ncbi:hypothetical protein LY90DRAFT_498742 [Neocallimastix californiae]|uniref:polynucleotide adenylyltransferase n=1 Tax=Neocallimastix californiae TaxID=1754190 RepID=A0A1Y2FUZ2_9FUNG|nr:hypothetical protein LY90DRAFT_498742 [Neocallimastix californiae]|eukprot:ORY86515.1 hypothetical protein LY90DRAFT_498742 [Neocallimastix californiae]